jgi:hypothetical protein
MCKNIKYKSVGKLLETLRVALVPALSAAEWDDFHNTIAKPHHPDPESTGVHDRLHQILQACCRSTSYRVEHNARSVDHDAVVTLPDFSIYYHDQHAFHLKAKPQSVSDALFKGQQQSEGYAVRDARNQIELAGKLSHETNVVEVCFASDGVQLAMSIVKVADMSLKIDRSSVKGIELWSSEGHPP